MIPSFSHYTFVFILTIKLSNIMKRLSLILASLVLFADVSFANPVKSAKQEKPKTEKKVKKEKKEKKEKKADKAAK